MPLNNLVVNTVLHSGVHAFVRKALDWLGRWVGSGEMADFSKQFQGAQLALELLSLGHHDEHSCLSPLAK